ncbi:MAG: hypothetical protein ACE5JX_19105 [Acidobacteriota bacterium]
MNTVKVLAVFLLLGGLGNLWAQSMAGRNSPVRRFEEEAPQVGEPLPDVTVLDSRGQPFPLRNLKGSYTVLVFGCLT